jgi:hypothetical protein
MMNLNTGTKDYISNILAELSLLGWKILTLSVKITRMPNPDRGSDYAFKWFLTLNQSYIRKDIR